MSKQLVKRIKGIGLAVMLVFIGQQSAFADQLSYNDAVVCSAYFMTTSALLEMSDDQKLADDYEMAAEYFYSESTRLANGETDEQVEQAIMTSAETMADVVIEDFDNYAKLESLYENSCIAKAEATLASAN